MQTRKLLWDRPFNLQGGGGGGYGYLFRSEFFFRTRDLEYLFFFQNLTLGYMTKSLNQIIPPPPPPPPPNQNIFFSNIRNQNILEKNHTPPSPLEVKWSVHKPMVPNDSVEVITSKVAIMTWLTVVVYLCHKRPRI